MLKLNMFNTSIKHSLYILSYKIILPIILILRIKSVLGCFFKYNELLFYINIKYSRTSQALGLILSMSDASPGLPPAYEMKLK